MKIRTEGADLFQADE